MTYFLFRRGDGNEGNYPRFIVELAETHCPFAALRALVANEYISGSATRRYIIRTIEVDGEAEYGIHAYCHEGPKGEQAFGSAWLTAELEPYTPDDVERSNAMRHTLREALDDAAWRLYRKHAAN